MNYERKSFTYKRYVYDEFWLDTDHVKTTTNFNYITLPILIKYELGKSKQFFVDGGIFLGYLLKTTSKTKGSPDDDSTTLNKKLDMGLSFGIGKKFKLNDKHNLIIEIRDNLGLVNISDVYVIGDGSIKTNALNVILTWDFKL